MSDEIHDEAPAQEPIAKYIPPGYEAAHSDPAPTLEPDGERGGWASWTALRVTLGRVPLWFLVGCVPLVFGVIAAQGWVSFFERNIGGAYAPGEQLGWLTAPFRTDHAAGLGELRAATGIMAAVMTVLAMLIGVFCAGGWLQVFLERTSGHSVDRFFHGGARYFWRFFRVLIGVLLFLALGKYLIYGDLWSTYVWEGLFEVKGANFENLQSEATARRLTWLQDGTMALWFAGVMVWADYLRTRLAFLGSRSVLWQGIATFFMLLVRPITTLRPMLVLLVFELLVLVGLGWLSAGINHGVDAGTGMATVWLLAGLSVLGVFWKAIVNAARYHAAVQVVRVVVEPLGVEDPWENTVGGPGGPRYPVGQEEYAVSI